MLKPHHPKSAFFLFASLIVSSWQTAALQAQGSDSLASRKKDRLASVISYHTPYGYTQVQQMLPDSRLQLHSSSLTTVHITGTCKQDRHQPTSLGNGFAEFSVGADSYIRLAENAKRKARKKDKEYSDAFWGNAHYTYGRKQAVIGNETSDYLTLFPYIMSDTAGGDLTYEKYSFGGGYARGNDKIRWGASLDYVAKQEYRKVDPRPRNITSDLNIEASMAFRLPGRYFLGFGIEGGLYNQSNQVAFYNPLGGPPTYNMTGLESYLTRFSLDNTSIDYAGGHYGSSLSLSPGGRQGWHSTLSYKHQRLTRTSNGGSANIELDLNTLDYDIFSWKTAYWNPGHHRLPWGISLCLDYEHRYGKDIIYGPSQSNIYPELMRVRNMDIHHGETRLQADFLWEQTDGDFFLQPFAAYEFLSYRHQSPDESFEGISFSLGGRLRKAWALSGNARQRQAARPRKGSGTPLAKENRGRKINEWPEQIQSAPIAGENMDRPLRRSQRENVFSLGGELSYCQGSGVLDPAANLGLDARWAIGIGKASFHIDLSARYGYFLSESWRNMMPWAEYARRSGHSPHVFRIQLGIGFNF